MMDLTLHLSVVITCVVIASILSILFINSIFTAEKREKIAAAIKQREEAIKAAAKRQKKLQQQQQQAKKDLKREKKRVNREQQKDTIELEESDVHSEPPSVEDEPQSLLKSHVEFDPDPEVIVGATPEAVRRASIAEREKDASGNNSRQKTKKEKKNKSSGILVNKNEPVVVRENLIVEESANTFETKQPKDIIELKKSDKKDNKKEKSGKKDKNVAFEKPVVTAIEPQQPLVAEPVAQAQVAKDVKQHDEKARRGSPKTQAPNNTSSSNKSKQQSKKQSKETAATKELVLALDKLSDSDTIGVSLLMNLFRRAELNRSEIQLLIDYLLNKQQDTPATHSDWSDDICQKLKRQLEEKEKALAEEQESSIGIQAKLRELRAEINTERTQLNATVKSYAEKLQFKEQEIAALNQEIQSINEKFAQERKQFQAKLLLEKQTGSQDLFAQLQRIQSESAHKDKCINDLTCLVNACNKANEELKQNVSLLEQQREELEQISNNRIFELEKIKALEMENAECKMELHHLQNAQESNKADLVQARQELEAFAARNADLLEKQKQIDALRAKNDELLQQLAGVNMQAVEQSKEQSGLQATFDTFKSQLAEKEKQLKILHDDNASLLQQLDSLQAQTQHNAQTHQDLQKLVQSLQQDIASKHQQLQQVEQSVDQLSTREKKLLQQLHEQKEKNDDLRKKNWKLVEALQSVEKTAKQNKAPASPNANLVEQQQLFVASQKQSSATANTATVSSKEEKHVREIFQRLYPEAVKACASTALSTSLEQWVQQLLETQLKLAAATQSAGSSSNKSTQMSSSSINHVASTHTNNILHNDNLNNNDNRISSNSSGDGDSSSGSANDVDPIELRLQNTQLRAKVDELTKLVTKTSNTLSALEGHAREEHEKWQNILLLKDEEISRLQHSNGASGI